ncbi:hypothetical protein EV175_004489 [Coemansia sp. RSA 1933]|nr:hypothetical protein EV175_004489 [Coemansia sp. RSA 1933]
MVRDMTLDFQVEKALELANPAEAAEVESIEPQSSLSDKPTESRSHDGGSNITLFEKQTVLIAIKSLQVQIDKVNEELEELSAQILMVGYSDTATIERLLDSNEKAEQKLGMLYEKKK